jgi:hypothetical protein
MCFETRHQETNEPRERRDVTNFHGPKPEAILIELVLCPRNESVAVLS